jgi:HSP90 family molecular chaperone
MGMDRHIIENYLLKIGKSYYNSADFKADIFEYKKMSGKDFTPISRYGIGILSCFILGDRIRNQHQT